MRNQPTLNQRIYVLVSYYVPNMESGTGTILASKPGSQFPFCSAVIITSTSFDFQKSFCSRYKLCGHVPYKDSASHRKTGLRQMITHTHHSRPFRWWERKMREPLQLVLGSSPGLRRQSDFSLGKMKTLKEGFEVGDQISVLVSRNFYVC